MVGGGRMDADAVSPQLVLLHAALGEAHRAVEQESGGRPMGQIPALPLTLDCFLHLCALASTSAQ